MNSRNLVQLTFIGILLNFIVYGGIIRYPIHWQNFFSDPIKLGSSKCRWLNSWGNYYQSHYHRLRNICPNYFEPNSIKFSNWNWKVDCRGKQLGRIPKIRSFDFYGGVLPRAIQHENPLNLFCLRLKLFLQMFCMSRTKRFASLTYWLTEVRQFDFVLFFLLMLTVLLPNPMNSYVNMDVIANAKGGGGGPKSFCSYCQFNFCFSNHASSTKDTCKLKFRNLNRMYKTLSKIIKHCKKAKNWEDRYRLSG